MVQSKRLILVKGTPHLDFTKAIKDVLLESKKTQDVWHTGKQSISIVGGDGKLHKDKVANVHTMKQLLQKVTS